MCEPLRETFSISNQAHAVRQTNCLSEVFFGVAITDRRCTVVARLIHGVIRLLGFCFEVAQAGFVVAHRSGFRMLGPR